jgi:hypothetical protein
MSRVYVCDVCKIVKPLNVLNELTRNYRVNEYFFGIKEKQEIIHMCHDCWDRIKNEVGVTDGN